jgi:hypothetical protein
MHSQRYVGNGVIIVHLTTLNRRHTSISERRKLKRKNFEYYFVAQHPYKIS